MPRAVRIAAALLAIAGGGVVRGIVVVRAHGVPLQVTGELNGMTTVYVYYRHVSSPLFRNSHGWRLALTVDYLRRPAAYISRDYIACPPCPCYPFFHFTRIDVSPLIPTPYVT